MPSVHQGSLFELIRSFSKRELKEIDVFLGSPYFNKRDDLQLLFQYCRDNPDHLEKSEAWVAMGHAKGAYNDQKMRLFMSYLLKLIEKYMALKALELDPVKESILVMEAYKERGVLKGYKAVSGAFGKKLERSGNRSEPYYENAFLLTWNMHQTHSAKEPTDNSALLSASRHADTAFLIRKLRLICLLTAHATVYSSDYQLQPWDRICLEKATQLDPDVYPVVSIYLDCYRMLSQPEEEVYFQSFKLALLQHAALFDRDELHGLFIWAVNYCVRRLNAGEERYNQEALELYKYGLEKELVFEENAMSRFTFHNIVAAGLHTHELDWVRYFINTYRNKLDKKYREASFSFNLARLEYASGNRHYVLDLLQRANYRDPLLNLAAKTLLLKCYFEEAEYDLLQSHLDAMRNYIHRKRVLGYHRRSYLNLIRYTEKLMHLASWDEPASRALKTEIESENELIERPFLLKMLDVFQ